MNSKVEFYTKNNSINYATLKVKHQDYNNILKGLIQCNNSIKSINCKNYLKACSSNLDQISKFTFII